MLSPAAWAQMSFSAGMMSRVGSVNLKYGRRFWIKMLVSMCRCVTHLVDVDVGGAGHGDGGYGGVCCVHVECHHLSCEALNILRKFE